MDNLITIEKLKSALYFSDVFSSEKIIQCCAGNIDTVIIVTDDNVSDLYAKRLLDHLKSHSIKTKMISIIPGEHSKSRETKSAIEDKMFSFGCGRDTLMIALGGGVVTDLTGFVAATYCRGIPVIYIPTTLLAMVDASIGGKTGINTPFGKNTIGTFTHPQAIFIDVKFLNTLSDSDYIGALSEIIKHALIYDKEYLKLIALNLEKFVARDLEYLSELILKSCEIKSNIVFDDEKEKNKREMLNFGHTVAHALEHASEYRIPHGHAVAIGMIAESFISNKMGYLSDEEFDQIKKIIEKLLSKVKLTIDIPIDKILNAFKFDKKNKKQMSRFVMLNKIGSVVQDNASYSHTIDEAIVRQAIDYMLTL